MCRFISSSKSDDDETKHGENDISRVFITSKGAADYVLVSQYSIPALLPPDSM